MKTADILKQAKRAAALHKKNRRDPRYVKTIGFLVAKGFLHTNAELQPMPNIRINIEDAIWAGITVEPRILEVLPAAVIRMEKHFDYNPELHVELKKVIELLEEDKEGEFYGIPMEKIKPWLNLRLRDKRVKKVNEKKVMKTFRFSPDTIAKIKNLKKVMRVSETELLENLIARA